MDRIFKATRVAVLTLAIAAGSAGLASAQQGGVGTTGGASNGGTSTTGNAADTRNDRGFDYGWLGLIGLAGLIPLFMRRNGHANHRNSANHGTVR